MSPLPEIPIKEIYTDVAHPALAELGQTIALPFSIVNALLSPCYEWVQTRKERLDAVSTLVAEKVQDIPPASLCAPEPYVVVPALQAISYCMDNENLKNMFANLLAKSINSDYKDKVHPAFVDIIKQLSPSDAEILKFISGNKFRVPVLNLKFSKNSYTENLRLISGTSFFDIADNLLDTKSDMEMYDMQVSVSNLQRLGLIGITFGNKISGDVYDEPIKTFEPLYKKTQEFYVQLQEDGYALEREKGILTGTAIGKSFCFICL